MTKYQLTYSFILVKLSTIRNSFVKFKFYWLFSCIVFAVWQRRLTDAIELLEQLGFFGEDALFILQRIGGAK